MTVQSECRGVVLRKHERCLKCAGRCTYGAHAGSSRRAARRGGPRGARTAAREPGIAGRETAAPAPRMLPAEPTSERTWSKVQTAYLQITLHVCAARCTTRRRALIPSTGLRSHAAGVPPALPPPHARARCCLHAATQSPRTHRSMRMTHECWHTLSSRLTWRPQSYQINHE